VLEATQRKVLSVEALDLRPGAHGPGEKDKR